MAIKSVVILGSTGSIGINALKVIDRFSDQFRVVGLSAYNNIALIENQIKQFKPKFAAVSNTGIEALKSRLRNHGTKLLNAQTDIDMLATMKEADIVLIAMRGFAALKPFLAAIKAGKTVAVANKEAFVVAGDLVVREAKKYQAKIIPVDSEQSAIFQCLNGNNRHELRKIHLTASGGPLLDVPAREFAKLSVERILKHPRWQMGRKITVDSATLMNKGYEIIEAKWLFDVKIKDIEVLIHPQAIIHSMVEFKDGSIIAQLGITDMRLPIQYALTYPERLDSGLKSLDFFDVRQLDFRKPDYHKFPALQLAITVGEKGGTLPCVLNAADEVAVEAFLERKISFNKIYSIVEKVVSKHKIDVQPSLNKIFEADRWAREEVRKVI